MIATDPLRSLPKVKEMLKPFAAVDSKSELNRLTNRLLHKKIEETKPVMVYYLKEFGKDTCIEKLIKRYRLL